MIPRHGLWKICVKIFNVSLWEQSKNRFYLSAHLMKYICLSLNNEGHCWNSMTLGRTRMQGSDREMNSCQKHISMIWKLMCLFIQQQKVAYKYKQEEESQKSHHLCHLYCILNFRKVKILSKNAELYLYTCKVNLQNFTGENRKFK